MYGGQRLHQWKHVNTTMNGRTDGWMTQVWFYYSKHDEHTMRDEGAYDLSMHTQYEGLAWICRITGLKEHAVYGYHYLIKLVWLEFG